MKEGGSLFGGTCEHCEDRAPSGPRQDSVRTLSGLSGQLRELHKPGSLSLPLTSLSLLAVGPMPHDHVPVESLGVAESDKSALPTVLPAAGEGADDLDIAGIAPAAPAKKKKGFNITK